MGWWRKREVSYGDVGFMYDYESGNYHHRSGVTISGTFLKDLPLRVEGRGNLKQSMVGFIDEMIPGIAEELYEWFEPQSTGELFGEMMRTWGMGASPHATEEPKEDSQGPVPIPDPSAPVDRSYPVPVNRVALEEERGDE